MPPVLETPRLRLRPPRLTDLEDIYRLGSDPQVMQHITPGKTQSRAEAKADLEKRIRQSDDRLGYWITEEKHSGDFVGWMALKPLEQSGNIEIGYRFLAEKWGRGYATEGSQRILAYAFEELILPKVVAVAREENRASTRVMEKMGLKFIGKGRYYGVECVYYELWRAEYLQAKNKKR